MPYTCKSLIYYTKCVFLYTFFVTKLRHNSLTLCRNLMSFQIKVCMKFKKLDNLLTDSRFNKYIIFKTQKVNNTGFSK